MRLVEPLALLEGRAAAEAIGEGAALPLAGGPVAYALARLIGEGAPARIAAVRDLPAAWRPAAARVAAAPDWGGLPARPLVMGIINVTPDSFSDGGRHADAAAAIAAGWRMAEEGADLLDIGGETTRPGAGPVPPEEERRRVLPVIGALRATGLPLSVDTRNAATMRAAVAAGAAIVNDVSALAHDPAAAPTVGALGCGVVLMHMRGDPATMAAHASYGDVALEVTRELARRVAAAEAAGIARAAIAVDPGIGFAKTAAHNLELLRRLPLLLNLGCRVLLGASRKSFIGRLGGAARPDRRGPGSLAVALHGLARGASILRVHDVAETVQAVRLRRALAAADAPPAWAADGRDVTRMSD